MNLKDYYLAAKQQTPHFDIETSFETRKRDTVKDGLLITFEGGEGVGKSTQATRLYLKLQSLGIDVVKAQEPGSSGLGHHIRRWIKKNSTSSPLAETLLFEAARAQLLFEFVRPALKLGQIVILDRFTDSTLAYQGYARGLDLETIEHLNGIATHSLIPQLTVLLDLEPEKSLDRIALEPTMFGDLNGNGGKRVEDQDQLRFEREDQEFHENVRKGYIELSKKDSRWCVVRADQASHRIHDAIMKRVRRLLIDNGIPEALFKS